MKHLRLSAGLGVFVLLAVSASVALLHPHKAAADPEGAGPGGSYVTTVKDSTGAFASRGVITLHADGTLSVIDSGQGGPTYFFSNQLGSWAPDGKGGLVGRTIDFDFPPNADVARLDYTFKFPQAGKVTGTITLTTFPLQSNPLDGGGTAVSAYTFSGTLVTP